ncbi:hypothetical protein FNF07_03065 [Trinickia caryophylli]|nr:hypothetical protein C0Z17_28075 [Trinickia caryophylli]TRX17313.1 hypothetical protein FNF07_03065 [Trinickia caryophylli]
MPSTERYTETTSLEFILNPFKLFFTASVVQATTNLERPRCWPTIFVRNEGPAHGVAHVSHGIPLPAPGVRGTLVPIPAIS